MMKTTITRSREADGVVTTKCYIIKKSSFIKLYIEILKQMNKRVKNRTKLASVSHTQDLENRQYKHFEGA